MKINWDDSFIQKLSEAQKVHIQFLNTAERILEVLADHPKEGLPEKEISERAKARKQRLVKTLRKLVEIKSLVRIGKGTKKDPYRYLYFQEPKKTAKSELKSSGTLNLETTKKALFSCSISTPTVKK